MTIPVVSEDTRNKVWEEVREIESRDESFTMEMINRLEGKRENPTIADFLYRILDAYQHKPWVPKAIGYGFLVYRMLEIEAGGTLPKISEDVGAPMQHDFFQRPRDYTCEIMERITAQNYQVAVACIDMTWLIAISDDPEEQIGATWVFMVGALVYRFIESQFEANDMSQSTNAV
jgi:hypothetical protein